MYRWQTCPDPKERQLEDYCSIKLSCRRKVGVKTIVHTEVSWLLVIDTAWVLGKFNAWIHEVGWFCWLLSWSPSEILGSISVDIRKFSEDCHYLYRPCSHLRLSNLDEKFWNQCVFFVHAVHAFTIHTWLSQSPFLWESSQASLCPCM